MDQDNSREMMGKAIWYRMHISQTCIKGIYFDRQSKRCV